MKWPLEKKNVHIHSFQQITRDKYDFLPRQGGGEGG